MTSESNNSNQDFLGQGVAFPLQITPHGGFAMAGGDMDIEQSIRIILGTAPGERVMRPEFGCRVHELIFEPLNAATQELIREYVEDALGRWEPRIEVREVIVNLASTQDGAAIVEIKFDLKAPHTERSIVHPFYLTPEEEA